MTDSTNSVWMQIDNTSDITNGVPVMLVAPPRQVNSRTMIPLRFVAEAAGYSICNSHGPRMMQSES